MDETINPEKHLWFLNTFVTIHISNKDNKDGISVIEHRAPHGDSPPQHIHHNEDEIFHIMEGEFRVKIGDKEQIHHAGEIILAPKKTPHTYRVESKNGGRWVTITVNGDFEQLVRTVARPAEVAGLPAKVETPSAEAIKHLAETAAKFGIEITGPPLH